MRLGRSRLWPRASPFNPLTIRPQSADELPTVEANLGRVAHQVALADRLAAVWATTARAMSLHVLNARAVKVPSSRRVRGLSRWVRNFAWMAQYSPCRSGYQVDALVGGGRSRCLRTSGGHVAQQPDVSKYGSIFRRGLEIELRQALKHSALFAICWKLFGALPKSYPRTNRRQ